MKFILLILLAFTVAACGDDAPAASSTPAPHHDLIYTQYGTDPVMMIVRGRSDGSGRRAITEGRLVAAPVEGRILFLGPDELDLYSGTIDGGTPVRIERGGVQAHSFQSAEIAPDGEHFLSIDWDLQRGTTGLSLQRIDGTDRQILVENVLPQSRATFSPDGNRIAYFTADRRLATINVDGTDTIMLTPRPASTARDGEVTGWRPDWSPDGRWIAVESFATNTIDVIAADGSATPAPASFLGAHPQWSPDGKEIACTVDAWIVVQPIGGTARGVIRDPFDPYSNYPIFPQWSPDGLRLLPHIGSSAVPSTLLSIDVANGTSTYIDADVMNAYWLP